MACPVATGHPVPAGSGGEVAVPEPSRETTYNPRHSSMGKLLSRSRFALLVGVVVFFFAGAASATDWAGPARDLARKISAKTGPGAVAISFKNVSSLSASDAADARRSLELALRSAGLRIVAAEQAVALVRITWSENAAGYVWIAEVHQGTNEDSVAMVGLPRADGGSTPRVPSSVTVRKQILWFSAEPILDAVVLDASGPAPHLAVLAPERVNLYRRNAGRWEMAQELPIPHAHPWPRDLRGRLTPRRDHLFDAFLPGVMCSASAGATVAMQCRESDEPWPLVVGDQPPQYAFYGAQRNFFNGTLRPGFGQTRSTAPFYSAAGLPRANYTLWLFTGVDGAARLTDGVNERSLGPRGWGSDVATVMNGCGGPQALISAAGDANMPDSVVALDVPEREPMVVSQPLEFSGPVTALWSTADGTGALAVSKNLKTGQYEAYTLTLACGQ